MSFKEITTVFELVFSATGLIFIIVGWIIPFKQSMKLNKLNHSAQLEQAQRELKIKMLDEQISKYYGPISAILIEQQIIAERIWTQLGRYYIFEKGHDKLSDLAPNEQLIWKHFIDTYKLPLQHKIVEIMQHNAHLAVHGEHDASVDAFLEYVLGWELLDDQMHNSVPNSYEYYYRYNYPKEFNEYIHNMLKTLIEKKETLISQME
ncbi:hypothetical protein [uncultured Phocaeicola sp.]|uniref:hypothetical protein n=1 Tax=uncultured Phocaeicola sp. TaxID=990718 RepID=UPI0025A1B95C|nr:hypothetical protein [uncultured Phocaeicola sp.]